MKTLFNINQDHRCATEQAQKKNDNINFLFYFFLNYHQMTSRNRRTSRQIFQPGLGWKKQMNGERKMYVMQLK